LMKLAEVVRGVRTEAAVVEALLEITARAGHTAVVCTDTPGFIVNHAGRGYGTESLRALNEGVAPFHAIDRILREQVDFDGRGFRMGPFELLDLTALDVSHPAMESIYHQFYEEPRFRPSVTTAQRLAAGLVGRKRGEGFYRYVDGKQQPVEDAARPAAAARAVWVAPGPAHAALCELVGALDGALDTGERPDADSIALAAPLGVDATSAAIELGLDARQVVAIDTLFPVARGQCRHRVLMTTPATDPQIAAGACALAGADGARVTLLRDSAGFVAQRVIAVIVAIACEIAQQRIARPQDIDTAVRLGLGYPIGPLAMGDRLGPARVAEILHGIERVTGDPRYRPSLWLRRRAQLGLSLLAED
ncbi:MAG: 3-hydroxyacyl-CoA dehydrogenase, partial [Burkholderiales bacterium]